MTTTGSTGRRRAATVLAVGALAGVLLAGCSSGATHPGPSGSATPAPPGPVSGGYLVDQYGSPPLGPATARQYSVISAQPARLTPSVAAALKAANPSVRLLLYVNGSHLTPTEGAVSLPSSAYEHSGPGGAVCHPPGFSHNDTMDPTSPAWISFLGRQVSRQLAANPRVDGIFLDTVGPDAAGGRSGCPYDVHTGHRWTVSAYLSALWRGPVRAAVAAAHARHKVLVANGLGSPSVFFRDHLVDLYTVGGVDGGVAENWLPGRRLPGVAAVAAAVAMAREASAHGAFLPIVNGTGCHGGGSRAAQVHLVTLAAFDLGNTNPASAFAYTNGHTARCLQAGTDAAWNRVPVGAGPLRGGTAAASPGPSTSPTTGTSASAAPPGASDGVLGAVTSRLAVVVDLGRSATALHLPAGRWCSVAGGTAPATVSPDSAVIAYRC